MSLKEYRIKCINEAASKFLNFDDLIDSKDENIKFSVFSSQLHSALAFAFNRGINAFDEID